MAASALDWRASACAGVTGRGDFLSSMNTRSRVSCVHGRGCLRTGTKLRGNRTSFRKVRRSRSPTKAMLSFDENDSGDDYEFDPNFGLKSPKRERQAFEQVEWHADTLQRKAKDVLDKIDKSGIWILSTTGGALLITAFDSLFDTGTVDPVALTVLAPDWINAGDTSSFIYDLLAGLYVDPEVVASAENTLQSIFLFEFVLRAWAERFSLSYLKSPVSLVDFAAILPSIDTLFGGLGGAAASASLRPLRLFRLLRLLRLLDDGNGKIQTANNKMTDKVTSVAVEFLCVFLISGELFYDLEYQYNPAISDVGDALYWSFLTLTGIGQPFEAVTAQGRVATVGSILTALVVVPLQLAKIVSVNNENGVGGAQGKTMQGGMLGSGMPAPNVRTEVNESFGGLQASQQQQQRSTPPSLEIFETFDSVDEAYATEVFGLEGVRTREGGVGGVTDGIRIGGVTGGSTAYDSVKRELTEARARVAAFEVEIDALRAENEQLRQVVTRREIKANAERL